MFNFKLHLFIAGIEESDWLLYINFVSLCLPKRAFKFQEYFGSILLIFYLDNHIIYEQIQFYFFLFNLRTYYFLFCLTVLARKYRTMLKRSGERRYFCLSLDCSGNASSFSPLCMMLAVVFFLKIFFFIMLRTFPSIISLLKIFVMTGCWIS